jgi:hypothetical protein
MNERLQYLACYVGSAAVVAFLGACIDAPRVATFTCETPAGSAFERCVQVKDTPGAEAADAQSRRDADALAVAILN